MAVAGRGGNVRSRRGAVPVRAAAHADSRGAGVWTGVPARAGLLVYNSLSGGHDGTP